MGIEPTRPAWKAGVLPLNYTRIQHDKPCKVLKVTRRGFEPLYDSVKGCCVKPLHQRAKMADGVGFEPTRRVDPAYTISNRAPSAARTSIHSSKCR